MSFVLNNYKTTIVRELFLMGTYRIKLCLCYQTHKTKMKAKKIFLGYSNENTVYLQINNGLTDN